MDVKADSKGITTADARGTVIPKGRYSLYGVQPVAEEVHGLSYCNLEPRQLPIILNNAQRKGIR